MFIIRNDDRGVDYAEFPKFWELLHEGDDTVRPSLFVINMDEKMKYVLSLDNKKGVFQN